MFIWLSNLYYCSLTTKANVSSLLWPVNVQVKLIFVMGKKLARGSREYTFSPFDGRVTLCMVSNHPKGQRIFPEFASLPLRTPGMGVQSESTYLLRVSLGPGAHALLLAPGHSAAWRSLGRKASSCPLTFALWLSLRAFCNHVGSNQWPPAYSDMSYEVIKQEVIWPDPVIGFPRVSAFLQENMVA